MKVLALNSSPNADKGGTASILNPFIKGMKESGVDVELIYLNTLKIESCLGCGACWSKTPGHCIQKDDMQTIYPKIAESDILVIATPVYLDGMNSQMKKVIDRCYALLEPIFEIKNGHTRHSRRPHFKSGKIVLVSVCGHPESDNFSQLVTHVKAICSNLDREYAGALLRPIAWFLPIAKQMGFPVDEIYSASRDAGIQLIQNGEMSSKTLETVSKEVVPSETFVNSVNQNIQRILNKLESNG